MTPAGPVLAWRLVTVDIDGTLTRRHGWAEIAEAFGRDEEFREVVHRFRAGATSTDEYVGGLLALARDHSVEEVEAILDRTPKLDGIAEGVDELRGTGCRVALLSHNPTYVTAWYQRRFGFDDAAGTAVPAAVRGPIGRPGRVRADKAAGLAALLGRAGGEARTTVHIGDGLSDAELFGRLGGGIALNASSPAVRAAADLALSTDDFRDVVGAVRRLAPRK